MEFMKIFNVFKKYDRNNSNIPTARLEYVLEEYKSGQDNWSPLGGSLYSASNKSLDEIAENIVRLSDPSKEAIKIKFNTPYSNYPRHTDISSVIVGCIGNYEMFLLLNDQEQIILTDKVFELYFEKSKSLDK